MPWDVTYLQMLHSLKVKVYDVVTADPCINSMFLSLSSCWAKYDPGIRCNWMNNFPWMLRLGKLGVWLTYVLRKFDETAEWIKRRSSWMYTDLLLQKSHSFSASDCFKRPGISLSLYIFHQRTSFLSCAFCYARNMWKKSGSSSSVLYVLIMKCPTKQPSFRSTYCHVLIKVLIFSTLHLFVKSACPFEFRVSVAVHPPSIHCGWNSAITFDSLEIKWCIFFPTSAQN